jgi:hypothetical protein
MKGKRERVRTRRMRRSRTGMTKHYIPEDYYHHHHHYHHFDLNSTLM